MDLKCYLCSRKFSVLSEAVNHLKIIHLVKENVDEISCLVNTEHDDSECTKTFQTFRGMSAHVKKCVPKVRDNSEVEKLQEQVNKMNILFSLFQCCLRFVSISFSSHSLI